MAVLCGTVFGRCIQEFIRRRQIKRHITKLIKEDTKKRYIKGHIKGYIKRHIKEDTRRTYLKGLLKWPLKGH